MRGAERSLYETSDQASPSAMQVDAEPLPKSSGLELPAISEGKRGAAMRFVRVSRGARPCMHAEEATGQQVDVPPETVPARRTTTPEAQQLSVPGRVRAQHVDVSDSDDDSGARGDPSLWW
ncbi:unnamed protein product, partial [Cuscuta epithymum]